MEKSEILESLLSLINEEIDRALNEDEALRMSDERRKKFKDTVFSNPPAYNSAGSLKEAPEPPAPPAPEAPTESDDTPAAAMGEPSDGMAGAEMPDAGTGADPATGGADASGAAPDGTEDPAMDDAEGGDMGGGGGDMMGGFGGGGGGGGMDFGGEEGEEGGGETADNPPPSSFDPFKDAESLEDRLQVILDTAESIAEETQDPQKVLKAVKGLIQNGFANPAQAAKTISDLFDTNNPVLQQVSRRLALFTYGV